MRIAIGVDWVGIEHKEALVELLDQLGHEVLDMGGFSQDMNDYPDFAEKVGKAVVEGKADRGVLLCGTGIGMSIAANKIPGIRAALCHDAFTTRLSRRHNDANVFVLGAWVTGIKHAKELLSLWLEEEYDGGRHIPRLEKIHHLDFGLNKEHKDE